MHPHVVLDSLAVRWAAWLYDVMWTALAWAVGGAAVVLVLAMVVEWVAAHRD